MTQVDVGARSQVERLRQTAPADHLIGAVTGGTYIVTGVTRSSTSEDFRRIAVKAKYSPTILA
jgi:hypothetical protein